MKVPLPPSDAGESASPSRAPSRAAHLAELERNLTLQQQRHHLQTQLVLQQQLHDELQQHLRLQQEHQQLQAQLKVCIPFVNMLSAGLTLYCNTPRSATK